MRNPVLAWHINAILQLVKFGYFTNRFHRCNCMAPQQAILTGRMFQKIFVAPVAQDLPGEVPRDAFSALIQKTILAGTVNDTYAAGR